jgi:putative endonuclease
VRVQFPPGAQSQPLAVGFFNMSYFVYILHSQKLNRFYVGTTTEVDRRLAEHNNAQYPDSFTVRGIPWVLFLSISCSSSEQAYEMERFIKRMKSSAFIRKLAESPETISEILTRFKK